MPKWYICILLCTIFAIAIGVEVSIGLGYIPLWYVIIGVVYIVSIIAFLLYVHFCWK